LDAKADRQIQVKSASDLEKMRRAGSLLGQIRDELAGLVEPGVSTLDLDRHFARRAEEAKVKAAFHGLYGFPGHICASINEEVVHGIPSADRKLREGDIVSLDMGIVVDGFYSDTALTVAVGSVSQDTQRLLNVTRECLELAIGECRAGNRLGDVGAAVQTHAEAAGFSVVREYTGHGIGRALHEPPKVPNFGERGKGPRLREGWVLAIEPMINAGTWKTETLADQWTVVTRDRKPSAHFEHTVAVTKNGAEALT
jgi:methionyl aminopeptidase